MRSGLLPIVLAMALSFSGARAAELVLKEDPAGRRIDLTCYALGQGGLSEKPMLAAHVEQLRQLHPQTIRLFVQEFYNLYPAHGRYHWTTLDRTLDDIVATGARPLLCLCFKPKTLFPRIDERLVEPTDYQEWEELIAQLVRHVNRERKYGVEYWEVGNEVDIGEAGGCPYLFQPDEYVRFYTHTASAILRADPKAKVGGPALAGYNSLIGDALLKHCANGNAPLHFFSWHVYDSDPAAFGRSIRDVKGKLASYPALKNVETVLDEWNMSLAQPNLRPAFQPTFILETTRVMRREGLTRSAYYHIRDWFVDEDRFAQFESPAGVELVSRWWNITPQYDGLYDNQGRVRPAYYAFKLLSLIRGKEWVVSASDLDLKGFAAEDSAGIHLVFWNFPADHKGKSVDVVLRLPERKTGSFQLVRLNAERAVNNLELMRNGQMADLQKEPLRLSLEPYEIRWLQIGR